MAGRKKGTPKTGGRKTGVANKTTIEFKQAVNNLLDHATPDMIAWLGEIDDPVKRFDVIIKIAEYAYPKLARTELTGDKDSPVEVAWSERADKEKLETVKKIALLLQKGADT